MLWLEQNKRSLFLEASIVKQKSNMNANGEIFKYSFAEGSHISKFFNGGSMLECMKKTESILLKITVKMW